MNWVGHLHTLETLVSAVLMDQLQIVQYALLYSILPRLRSINAFQTAPLAPLTNLVQLVTTVANTVPRPHSSPVVSLVMNFPLLSSTVLACASVGLATILMIQHSNALSAMIHVLCVIIQPIYVWFAHLDRIVFTITSVLRYVHQDM